MFACYEFGLFYHKCHQIMTIQLKIAFFKKKRISLNVEENQPVLFLETFYEVKLERSHPNLLCILFIGNKGH
jgi:hypothetical protein